jgi:PRTRC genetic system protein C
MATTLKTSTLPREFVFNGARIPDPDPQMSIDQVRDLLTPSYPEFATAMMTGPPEDTGTRDRGWNPAIALRCREIRQRLARLRTAHSELADLYLSTPGEGSSPVTVRDRFPGPDRNDSSHSRYSQTASQPELCARSLPEPK